MQISSFFLNFSWQSGILRKNIFYSKNWKKIEKVDQNLAKNIVFFIYWKIWSLIFTEFVLQWKIVLFTVFLRKSHIWEHFCFRDMGENVLS